MGFILILSATLSSFLWHEILNPWPRFKRGKKENFFFLGIFLLNVNLFLSNLMLAIQNVNSFWIASIRSLRIELSTRFKSFPHFHTNTHVQKAFHLVAKHPDIFSFVLRSSDIFIWFILVNTQTLSSSLFADICTATRLHRYQPTSFLHWVCAQACLLAW